MLKIKTADFRLPSVARKRRVLKLPRLTARAMIAAENSNTIGGMRNSNRAVRAARSLMHFFDVVSQMAM